MEFLECIRLLSDTDVLDRLLENSVDRERSTTACIAVHLGQNYAGYTKCIVETLRNLHCFLSRHSVGDEQNFSWLQCVLEMTKLVHHLFVDLKTTSGIDDHNAIAITLRLLDSCLRDLDNILRRAV